MNLILSRASKDYVLQVTGGRDPRVILYVARNGIAALSFASAIAVIQDVPTPQWLAQSLPPFSDLGLSLTTLAQRLAAAGIPVDAAFDLHVAGWQWSHRRRRPVLAGLSKDPGIPRFAISYLPRYWHLDRGKPGRDGRRGFRFNLTAAPDAYITRAQLQRVLERLKDLPPDDAESLLSGAVRAVAEAVPEAGPRRVSVLLLPPERGIVRVRSAGGAAVPWLVGTAGVQPAPEWGSRLSLDGSTLSFEGPLLPSVD